MKRILVLGDLCGDLLIPYREAKEKMKVLQEGKIDPVNITFRSGGTAGNSALVLGKMQEEPLLVTDAPGDAIGKYLLHYLEENGVNISASRLGNHGTQLCLAVLDGSADRVIFPWAAPGSRFPSFTRDSFCEELYHEAFHILCGGMVLNDDLPSMRSIVDFLEAMKRNGSRIYFDLNTRFETYGLSKERREIYERIIDLADTVLGSGKEEFSPLTGRNSLDESVLSLSSAGKTVIARNGGENVLFCENGLLQEVEVVPTICKNPVGAGDSFNGAYLYAKRRNIPTSQAISFANRIAGYVISHEGHLEIPSDYEEYIK